MKFYLESLLDFPIISFQSTWPLILIIYKMSELVFDTIYTK